MKKKLFFGIGMLLIVCFAGLTGCTLFSTDDEVTYKDTDGGVTLSKYEGNSSHDSLVVPDEFEGKAVVSISEYGIAACEYLSYISIGKNVTDISPRAFCGTNKVVSFTVAEDNPMYCSVDGVIFTKDMTELVAYPNYSRKEGSYVVPDGVKKIRSCAFYMCDSLKKVTLASSVEVIGEYAFFKCGGLEYIELNEGLKIVEQDGFSFTEGLKELRLPSTLEKIGDYGFYAKTSKLTGNTFTTRKKISEIECGKSWRPQATGMANSAIDPQYVGA